jgi:hypothetical protein
MAKKNTYDIPEYIDHMEQEGLLEQENVSTEELIESYIQVIKADDHNREQVLLLRDKGFDDNRIASKLLMPLHRVKEIK